MAIPRTSAILCAPANETNPFGAGMLSSDLIRGLKILNPNLVIPEPDSYREWYPGKDQGMTCIWIGAPSAPGSKKVCAMHLGMIPEWAQIGPDKVMIARGWRDILDRCIRCGVMTKAAAERVFKVDLTIDGYDTLCRTCRLDGLRSPADGKSGLCLAHRGAQENVARQSENRAESAWNSDHPNDRPKRGPYVF